LNVCGVTGAFNRYAMGIRRDRKPWVETHGYHHEVAPRLCEPQQREFIPSAQIAPPAFLGLLRVTDPRAFTSERCLNVWCDGSVQPSLRDGYSVRLRTVG
jgi:hypothetical protein